MNHKMKVIKYMILLIVLVSIISGCGIQSNFNRNDSQTDMYIDCVGREVKLPKNIKKVAAIDAFTGEAMVMIGAGDYMVACPDGVKSDILLQQIYPKLKNVSVVQSGGSINAEALLALNPDVVLVKDALYATEGEVEKLDKLGIPYLVIKYTSMEEQIEALNLIGEVVGGDSLTKAEQICDYYQSTIDKVKEISAKIPIDKKIKVYHSINQTFRTDGTDSLGADWVGAVGCINVSVGKNLISDGGGYFTSQEQVFQWNPDVIICNASLTKDYFENDKIWKELPAVEEARVYNIPVGATRWGQEGSLETFFGMLWLGVTVYPEYYSDINLKSNVIEFYKNILGIPIDDNMYEKIESGNGIRVASQNAGN